MSNKVAYAPVKQDGNGITKDIPFGWKISAATDLIVIIEAADGTQAILTPNTGYTVTFDSRTNGTGGNVHLATANAVGTIAIVQRKIPNTQGSSYSTPGGFDAKEIEKSLDRNSMMIQDLNYDSKRTLKVKVGSSILDLTVPEPNAGKTLKWKDDLLGLQNSDVNIDDIDTAVQQAQLYAQNANNSAGVAATNATTATNAVSGFMSTYTGALQDVVDGKAEIETQTIESLNQLAAAGYGLPPSNCTAMDIVKGTSSYFLKWKDPQDTIVNSQTLCTWAGTKIVRQVGHCPLSPSDGVVVYDSKIRNAYENTTFIDANITVGLDYYYTAFPYSANGAVNYDRKNQFGTIIYGYELNLVDSNPRTFFKRLADCENFHNAYMDYANNVFVPNEWADAWFVKKNRPVMLNYDGTVAYELNHFDHSKKLDGVTTSDVANTAFGGNAMSEIPQIWTKVEFDGLKIRKYFANRQVDATYRADAFYNKNNVLLDKIYMPMYNGSYISSKTRSLSGQTTGNSLAGATEITQAVANGAAWYTEVLSDRILINDLLLLMGGSFDTQSVYGNGHYTGGTAAANLLATGTMNQKGQFYGTNGTGVGMKVFYLENWWGNIWRRIAGWVNVNGVQKIKLTQSTQDGSTATNYNTDGTGYITIGATPSGTSGGYQSGFALNQYGFFPQVANGSSSTFSCDGFWFNNAQNNYAVVGGACDYGLLVGAFYSFLACLVSVASWDIGSSVSCKPL